MRDIRLTDTVALRGGTCDEGSDVPDGGSGGARAVASRRSGR